MGVGEQAVLVSHIVFNIIYIMRTLVSQYG